MSKKKISGIRLEQQFSQQQIKRMIEQAGLENIQPSPEVPFWCAVGSRKKSTETAA